jgi:hypothetical protein
MRGTLKLTILLIVVSAFSSIGMVHGLDAIDLAITPSGYEPQFSTYTYSEYVQIMENNGASPSDFMLVHDPVEVAVMAYFKGEVLVYIEVFEYASTTQAVEEYNAQKNERAGTSKNFNGPMFQRFISRDRIFQHQNYIALGSFDPYSATEAYEAINEVYELFIENIVNVISVSAQDEPAPTGDEAVWGIQIGDIITWEIDDDTFAGTITSGGSSSSANWVPEIVVVKISDSGHAVLIKEQRAITEYWWENQAKKTVNIPYEAHSWRVIDNNGMTITDSNDKQTMPLIYPLELNGDQLTTLIDETIEHLPEKSYTDGAEYYGVFGKTRSGSGYTPVETQWLDISVHRGTGIVTSYDWYYNNNDYGITARSQIEIGDTNFNLGSRAAPVAALKEFYGDIYTDPTEGTVGDTVEVQLDLYEEDGASIVGASVSAEFNGADYDFTGGGNGIYIASINTESLSAGDHSGTLYVEKTGYEPTSGTFTFSLVAESTPESPPTPGPGGIPAMPIPAILVGVSFALASRKRGK